MECCKQLKSIMSTIVIEPIGIYNSKSMNNSRYDIGKWALQCMHILTTIQSETHDL